MPKIICNGCQINFDSRKSKRKYCSHICYVNFFAKGRIKSQSEIGKIKKALFGKKYSEQRRRNIGAARIILLSEEIQNKLKNLLNFGMPDWYIKQELCLSDRVYMRYKKTFFPEGIKWQLKCLNSPADISEIEEIIKLTKLGYRYKRIAKLIGYHEKRVRNIIIKLSKRDPEIKCISYDDECWSERKESKPEKIIREYLDEMKIEYKQEAQIEFNSFWMFDFHILNSNLLIEVQGDYWHCNPKIYLEPINSYQKWAKKRDYLKKDYANKRGYEILYFWENDINQNVLLIKEQIKKEVEICKIKQKMNQ